MANCGNITPADEAVLDRYEGVASGLYLKRVLDVQMDARVVPALIYVAANNHYGSPRQGYLETILKGATDNGLPRSSMSHRSRFGGGANSQIVCLKGRQ